MKLHSKFILGLLVSLAITMLMFININNNIHAKYMGEYQTPTELRGTWHKWNRRTHKIDTLKVEKRVVYENNQILFKLHNVINFNKFNLNIVRHYQDNGYMYYTLNSKYNSPIKYWISSKKVNGKNVLKQYSNTGTFTVWLRNKSHHDYSYKYLESYKANGVIGK